MEDVNAALSTGFLQKGHTKNSLSKAYSIKGKQRNVNPKATFSKRINLNRLNGANYKNDKNQLFLIKVISHFHSRCILPFGRVRKVTHVLLQSASQVSNWK